MIDENYIHVNEFDLAVQLRVSEKLAGDDPMEPVEAPAEPCVIRMMAAIEEIEEKLRTADPDRSKLV